MIFSKTRRLDIHIYAQTCCLHLKIVIIVSDNIVVVVVVKRGRYHVQLIQWRSQ